METPGEGPAVPFAAPTAPPVAEVDVDEVLVRALLADQHPDLADLELRLVAAGWDNAMVRVGADLCARLPRRSLAAPLIEHEQRWLGVLAPRLPVAVPVPRRLGRPALGYPWRWSVVPWLPGEPLARCPAVDHTPLGEALAEVLAALHHPAPPEAPVNPYRGRHPTEVAHLLHARLPQVADVVDVAAIGATFDELATTPGWAGPPVWLHGDLHPLNVLVADGRLSGLVDFGDVCQGDPASDLAVGWLALDDGGRAALRDGLRSAGAPAADDATWRRARAWALHLGVAFLAHSVDSPDMERVGARAVAAAMTEG